MTADVLTDLAVGIAEHLSGIGAGVWSGLAAPAVASGGLPAIVLDQLPASPDYAVAVKVTRLASDAKLTDSLIGVQFRVRSGTRARGPASSAAERIYLACHALGRFRFGIGTDHELRIVDMYWQSEADIGPDQSGRPERSVNYYVQLNQPGTTRE